MAEAVRDRHAPYGAGVYGASVKLLELSGLLSEVLKMVPEWSAEVAIPEAALDARAEMSEAGRLILSAASRLQVAYHKLQEEG